ncbi:hypothetical protein BOSEA31B_12596 [Hyphomicrobiales bacterium]|nr:hypothetical protein BOSEA31B_12596 [Hyphomicrobiales bacterium]CAH1698365.1 hypothetical protein BOSEA1005_11418 [Hyphomicrobiales bacterium]CAI0342019.1 hypothetical protein BO1005MUT1_150015 [Hyphomicrobiales bacterium]
MDTPDLLPSAATIYARKIAKLTDALNQPDARSEAAEAPGLLMERNVLTPGPERGEVFATLHGALGPILGWGSGKRIGRLTKTNTPGARLAGVFVSLVAGAHNHRYRHPLKLAI